MEGALSKGPSLRVFVWGVVGVAAVLVGYFVYLTKSRVLSPAKPVPSFVYTGPVFEKNGQQRACTSQIADEAGRWVCTTLLVLRPGQVARSAIDPGGACLVRHVDQATGRWTCDSVHAPGWGQPIPALPVPPPENESPVYM